MKSSGRLQCWYVLFGGEIPQHMQVFCTKMLLKEGKKSPTRITVLFSITVWCCTYVFAAEPSSNCS